MPTLVILQYRCQGDVIKTIEHLSRQKSTLCINFGRRQLSVAKPKLLLPTIIFLKTSLKRTSKKRGSFVNALYDLFQVGHVLFDVE